MSTNELYNQKIIEFISQNRCNLSNANIDTFDENILNFKNIERDRSKICVKLGKITNTKGDTDEHRDRC